MRNYYDYYVLAIATTIAIAFNEVTSFLMRFLYCTTYIHLMHDFLRINISGTLHS